MIQPPEQPEKVPSGCGSSSGASGGVRPRRDGGMFGDALVFLVARSCFEQQLKDVFRTGPPGVSSGAPLFPGSAISEGGLSCGIVNNDTGGASQRC